MLVLHEHANGKPRYIRYGVVREGGGGVGEPLQRKRIGDPIVYRSVARPQGERGRRGALHYDTDTDTRRIWITS